MKHVPHFEISDLEKELELEMDDPGGFAREIDDDTESEADETDEPEADTELELAGEDAGDELDLNDTGERESDEPTDEFAERFYRLSAREFEDEADLDRELSGLLNEMEREYFWGSLKKLAKKGLKYGARQLAKRAMQYGKGLTGFQAITQLARGNLKGSLMSLAKQGLGAALRMNPAAAAGLTALRGLGFDPLANSEANRDAWNNYTAVVREAYDHLAGDLNEASNQVVEASRQASAAIQAALGKVQNRVPAGRVRRKVHRIRVRPGQRIKLIIEGIS